MRISMKNHMREALLTAALFGGIGAAFAQQPAKQPPEKQPPATTGSAQSGDKQPGPPTGVFVDGKLNVPNAPANTETTPAKFSQGNDSLDRLPIMARGPQLTDDQRKLILEHVTNTAAAAPDRPVGPSLELPSSVEMQAWPEDLLRQVPSLHDTKFAAVPGKILVVRPESRIVVGEIDR